MTDIIHLLSDDIANKIAAGEVVVRPAAVVKELLENSIDAGASQIQLIVKDGGKALIQVVDDGSGMSDTDARMSFERHATSKIQHINDLFSIRTMGFRGEALPSIAAVSKVELKTKLHGESIGTKISIHGSEFIEQVACQTAAGTNISVKSLFYNVPARRKFLKSTSVETKHIFEEFTRVALANPNVKFLLYNNDKEVYHLPVQSLHKRIAQLFGKKTEERIVPVQEDTDIVSIEGFIGKPEFAKRSKGEQYFFVNNRFIRSPYLNHAVHRAYLDYLEPKQQPLYVLFLTIDPQKIDINVHPSKHEVKFEDEQHVYAIVSAAVKHALSKFFVTPQLDFDMDPTFNRHEFFENSLTKSSHIQNDTSKQKSTFLNRGGQKHENWQDLYSFSPKEQEEISQLSIQQKQGEHKPKEADLYVQFAQRLIAAQTPEGLYLLDQRRAHQRILYEKLLQSIDDKGFASQTLLFPETIEISPQEMSVFKEINTRLSHLGFVVEEFGDASLIVHATPAELTIDNIEEVIHTLLAECAQPEANGHSLPEIMAKHLAMVGAIRYGQQLSREEMNSLFLQLQSCNQPNYGIRRDKSFIFYPYSNLDQLFSL